MKITNVKNMRSLGNYCIAASAENLVFVSGQIPIDIDTGELRLGTAREEALRILGNIEEILREYGLDRKSIVKTTVLFTDPSYWAEINEAYGVFFGNDFPTRTAFPVQPMSMGFKVEIEAIAAIK